MDAPPQLVKPPQSAYLIDLIFLLLAPMHPAMVVLALLQYAVRRSPFFARGFLGGRRVTAAWCIVFPGAVVYLMSNGETQDAPKEAVAGTLPVPPQGVGQPIAKPGNGVNALLTGNAVAGGTGNDDEVPESIIEARKILQQQGGIKVLANLIKAGLVDQTKGIEAGFEVKRSGRTDSEYAKIRAQLQPLIEKPRYPDLTPEQKQLREEMGV